MSLLQLEDFALFFIDETPNELFMAAQLKEWQETDKIVLV